MRYPLVETPGSEAIQRTEWNVRDSDCTLIFSSMEAVCGGTATTLDFAHKYQRPNLHLVLGRNLTPQIAQLKFLFQHNKPTLVNIAGPRESEEPGIYLLVRRFLAHAAQS